MNLKKLKSETIAEEDINYEKLIKELLEIVKGKSNEKDSSIKESIIQALIKFKD
jgi:hypothetical protein